MIPLLSGALLLAGLLCAWGDVERPATMLHWGALIVGASRFAPSAVRRLLRGNIGIGLLMTISATGATVLGHVEEAAALAFLYSIAEALEDRAMDRARTGLRALLALVPEAATVVAGGRHTRVPARRLTVGQVIAVRPGECVPTDGVVVEGAGGIDTSAVTGESIPLDVTAGSPVPAGAINLTASLLIEATAAGTDNSLTTIVALVEKAQREKGRRARLADRIARPLVPGVMVLAAGVAAIGALAGDPELWITRALVVLVAASPCALAIAVPVTVISAIGGASRFGMVIKSGAAFERLGEVRHAALDKTGTLTLNRPAVVEVVAASGVTEADVVGWAAALEAHSTHPLARAFTTAADDTPPTATDVTERAASGLCGMVEGTTVRVGNARWLHPGDLRGDVERMEAAGMTVVVVHAADVAVGVVGIRDELRAEAREAINALHGMGVGCTMLTGDNPRTAATVAAAAGIPDVHAGLRPEEKARLVRGLAAKRPTAMIGDGVNDAPALAAADVGIAMGATGSDAAVESADVAFTGNDLRLIPAGLTHARRARRIMSQNVALSVLLIAVLPPLAIFGVLGLAAVVVVHEGAEVLVILNGLRAGATRTRRSAPGGARRRSTVVQHTA